MLYTNTIFAGGWLSSGGTAAGIAVDGAGNAYVTGTNSAWDFPLVNPLVNTFLVDFRSRGSNGFLLELDPNGKNFLFSTYLAVGGSVSPHSIAIDAAGKIYLAGEAAGTG